MLNPIFRIAFLVSCGGILFGYGITSIAGVLDELGSLFALDLYQTQFLVFILVAGCFVGAAAAGPLSMRWGRRPTIALATGISALAYAYILTRPGYGGLIAARVCAGMAIGLYSMVVPMYAGETTQASRRGAVVALFQLAITGGILMSYVLALWLDGARHWHFVLGAGLAPALLAAVALAALPESPRWLAMRGRHDRAEQAARRLGLSGEWHATAVAEKPPLASHKGLLRQVSVKAVLILCCGLFAIQNLSGIDAILYYAPKIFEELGFSAGQAALGATMGLGLVNFLATMGSVAWVDRLGRRRLWIGGSAIMMLGLAAVAFSAWTNASPWLGLAGLCLYILAFALSLGPLPYVFMAELFPAALREKGIATASAISWVFNALLALSFLSIVAAIGLTGAMLLFLGICLLSLLVGVRLLPETRLVPLEFIESRVLEGRPLRELGASRDTHRVPASYGTSD